MKNKMKYVQISFGSRNKTEILQKGNNIFAILERVQRYNWILDDITMIKFLKESQYEKLMEDMKKIRF